MLSACRWQGIWMGCASDSSKWGRRCSCRTRSAGSIQMPSGSEQALEAGGSRRLWNESFFSAPQLKRDPLGRSRAGWVPPSPSEALMSYRPAYLVALATIVFASPSTPRAAQDAVVKEIRRLEDTWAAAEVKQDGEAVGRLLSADFLYTSPDGAPHTKAQLIQQVSTGQTAPISAVGSD